MQSQKVVWVNHVYQMTDVLVNIQNVMSPRSVNVWKPISREKISAVSASKYNHGYQKGLIYWYRLLKVCRISHIGALDIYQIAYPLFVIDLHNDFEILFSTDRKIPLGMFCRPQDVCKDENAVCEMERLSNGGICRCRSGYSQDGSVCCMLSLCTPFFYLKL